MVGAEEAGFDFAVSSDHFFPWLEEMGHSPNAWVTLGAAAQATSRIPLMTYVTCPILRYHPVVVAQQAATLQILSGGRFTLGIGAGENLNEHVVGAGWPPADVRHEMLVEALQVIRELFDGEGYTQLPRRPLRRRVGEAVGPAREAGADRHRRLRPAVLRHRRRAGRRDDRHRAAHRARRVVRRRRRGRQAADRADADQLRHRPRRRRSSARTGCSAGSASAGRSTRSCPARRPSTRPASSSAPRTSPGASRAAPTSTPSSRARRSTPTPGSPTWRWCRSAATSRRPTSSGRSGT